MAQFGAAGFGGVGRFHNEHASGERALCPTIYLAGRKAEQRTGSGKAYSLKAGQGSSFKAQIVRTGKEIRVLIAKLRGA